MKISTKLLLLSASLVLFTGVLAFYFANQQGTSSIEKQVKDRINAQSVMILGEIDRFIYERLNDISNIAKDPILSTPNISSTTIKKRLQEIKLGEEMVVSISFFDMDRFRLADSEGLSEGKVHSKTKYWANVTENTETVLDISISESVKRPVMHFGAVVRSNVTGEAIGLVVFRVLIDRLYEVFENIAADKEFWDHISVTLVDEKANILYSSNSPYKVLKEKFEEKELLSRDGVFVEDDRIHFVGTEKGYLNYKPSGWKLITAIPYEFAMQDVYKLQRRLLWIFAIILVVALVIGRFVSLLITNKISLLTQATDRIGKGELGVKIFVRSKDEIGQLAENFNLMADKLKNKMNEQHDLNKQLSVLNTDLEYKLDEIKDQREQIALQNEELNTAYEQLERKNYEVTSSINYAEKIQTAMLPDLIQLTEYFPDSFVLFKPRDIVSGDFYWYDQVKVGGNAYTVLAVADCTGHGVPGGFMSMMGSILFTSMISFAQKIRPEEVLTEMGKAIRVELHQEERDHNIQDGMEAGLAVIDRSKDLLMYSGAGRPLFIIRDGELIVYKGAKTGIGGSPRINRRTNEEIICTREEIQLEDGDQIYLFSDGYKDQLGGEKYRKFSIRRFERTLLAVSDLPFEDQKRYLEKMHLEWKGTHRQTDDILVMGFKYTKDQ